MFKCNECEAILPDNYTVCPSCRSHEAEIKAKDEEIAKLEQQIGFSDIYIQDLETQIKAKDERIKELEEAMKHKTCDGCVHEVGDMQDLHCAFCSRSCDDNFEPKDNA